MGVANDPLDPQGRARGARRRHLAARGGRRDHGADHRPRGGGRRTRRPPGGAAAPSSAAGRPTLPSLFPTRPPYRDLQPVEIDRPDPGRDRSPSHLGLHLHHGAGDRRRARRSLRRPRRRRRHHRTAGRGRGHGHRLEVRRQREGPLRRGRPPRRRHERRVRGDGAQRSARRALPTAPSPRAWPSSPAPRPRRPPGATGTAPRPSDDFSFGTNVLDMASLKHALYVTDAVPSARAYLVYEDIVTPGHYEAFYRRVSEEPGVSFTKGRVRSIASAGDGSLMLRLERSLLGDNVGLPVDLVVLAAGMVPTTADDTRAQPPLPAGPRPTRRPSSGSRTPTSSASPTRPGARASTPPAPCGSRWT